MVVVVGLPCICSCCFPLQLVCLQVAGSSKQTAVSFFLSLFSQSMQALALRAVTGTYGRPSIICLAMSFPHLPLSTSPSAGGMPKLVKFLADCRDEAWMERICVSNGDLRQGVPSGLARRTWHHRDEKLFYFVCRPSWPDGISNHRKKTGRAALVK